MKAEMKAMKAQVKGDLQGTLTSGKFWALLLSLAAIASGYFAGDPAPLTLWQAIQGTVAALGFYATGSVVERTWGK